MSERRCVNCRFFLMHTSMRAIKEPYCKLRGKWLGDTIVCSKWEQRDKPKTNADRIRAMTDEELAKQFAVEMGFCCPVKGVDCSLEPDCRVCFARWLKKECET